MGQGFDPYYDWLGIAPKDQPPNHYRLLGIDLFELKPNVIEHVEGLVLDDVKRNGKAM